MSLQSHETREMTIEQSIANTLKDHYDQVCDPDGQKVRVRTGQKIRRVIEQTLMKEVLGKVENLTPVVVGGQTNDDEWDVFF